MIRMITKEDEITCCRWYNWYVANSKATFEIDQISQEAFSARIKRVREKYPWIILIDEDRPVGYAYLDAFNTRQAYDWTADLSIYLDPEARGKGYGTQLMNEILKIAEEDGYYNIVSLVTDNNKASMHLHEKMGFDLIGHYQNFGYKGDEWLGVKYYVKTLRKPTAEMPEPVRNLDPYSESESTCILEREKRK